MVTSSAVVGSSATVSYTHLESLAHVRDEYIEIAQLTKACRGFESILSELTK